jgi:hypothetical protein
MLVIKESIARMRNAALIAAFCFLPAVFAFAQDSGAKADEGSSAVEADDEDLFGAAESVGEGSADSASVRDAFIQTAAPSLVGSYSGSVGLTGTWNDPWGGAFKLFEADKAELAPGSNIHLGFSAKPEKNLSFYGEVRTAYPFVKKLSDGTTVPDISIFNLYSKFDWEDKIFFSFGKQPLKWGQGMFFTPANDIFALSAIDYDNLNADREGPLSLRVNAPIPKTMATFYLYAVMNSASLHPSEIGVAPKFEIAFPAVEFSVSGYYQKDSNPRAIASVSWAGSDGLSAYGEGVLAFGSDKWFVVKDTRTVTTPAIGPLPAGEQTFHYRIVEKNDPSNVFFTGTVGLLYNKTWEKKLGLMIAAQYLFDGEGQNNMSLDDMVQAVIDRANPYYEHTDDPAVDITNPANAATAIATALGKFGSRLGQHYAGLMVSASSILDSDFSASVFAMANLADLSGWVKPQVSWQIFDRMSISGWASFSFGQGGDEYTNMGGIYKAVQGISFGPTGVVYDKANLTPPMQLGLTFSLGSGSF